MAGTPAPDEVVAGKYRLTTMLGQGGMGSVWEGVHQTLGTRVAIKFIENDYVESEEARQRFVNEAQAAARLRSKHVVQVFDQGVMADGRPYIVMEFLSGEPLDQRLERVGRLSLPETAVIIGQVCRALIKAHEAGIVHRDMKPENIFLVHDDEDGTEIAKVVDFGIAKFTDASLGVSNATRTGSVLGTPYYMSPEQARGLRTVDHRADLWSLGVIAYRCVTGSLPFKGEAVGDLLVKICTAPLPVPSQTVPELAGPFDSWFAHALGREPEERFQSARELGEALTQAAGLPPRAPMPSAVGLALASGPHPAITPSGPSHTPPTLMASPAHTAAAFTHNAIPTKRGAPIGLIAAAVAGLLVMGIVGVLVLRAVTAEAAPEPAASTGAPEASAVTTLRTSELPSSSAPDVSPTVAEPPASASAASEADPSTKPVAKPAVKPTSKPTATAKPTAKPTATAKPTVTAKPTATAKPTSTGKPQGVDLGY